MEKTGTRRQKRKKERRAEDCLLRRRFVNRQDLKGNEKSRRSERSIQKGISVISRLSATSGQTAIPRRYRNGKAEINDV